jgi:catalase
MAGKVKFATTRGAPIADKQTTIAAGARAPLLMQNHRLIEELAHQKRQRISKAERNVRGFALEFYTEEGNQGLIANKP